MGRQTEDESRGSTMIKPRSSTALFWIGVVAVAIGIVFGTILQSALWTFQTSASPTLRDVMAVIPIVARVAEGLGYAFVAAAFVVRHLEAREAAEARRSVHFIGRAARKDGE